MEQNESTEGETIEMKIERVVNNGEPIKDGAPKIYTEREEGVLPGYNPRTDRFDVAIDAMDKVSATKRAQREDRVTERKKALDEMNSKGQEKSQKSESTQGTDN